MARELVAEVLGMTPEEVRIHTTLCGGSFGRKLRLDYLRQAAIAAKAGNRPVKLIWSGNEDIPQDYYRPPRPTMIEVGLKSNGIDIAEARKCADADRDPRASS